MIKKTGITSKPTLIDSLISIIKPIKKGPNTAQIFPNIENNEKAESWFLISIFFASRLLLEACIGPIKKPILIAIIQKSRILSIKNKKNVNNVRNKIQKDKIFCDPSLSSILPSKKHPITPDKLIKIPKNRICDSDSPNKNDANILANAKIQITALL